LRRRAPAAIERSGFDGRSGGLRWEHNLRYPALVGSLEGDQSALVKLDHRAVGSADQKKCSEPGEVRKVADEHDVVVLPGQTSDPDRRVVVGRQRIGLLNIDIEQTTPALRRLASPRPAGMQHAGRPDAELIDGPSSHSFNVVDTACCQRPFRVVVLGLGLPMLNEIQLHPDHGTGRDAAPPALNAHPSTAGAAVTALAENLVVVSGPRAVHPR
jgi:hypothetical protein